jgi:hypothetical protein
MKRVLLALSLFATGFFTGCNRGGDPIDIGVGDAGVSSGTGGEGSGPTGTQGSLPADNPAADAPTENK